MERGKEAIKAKHVVRLSTGHKDSSPRSPLNLCALIVPSPNTGPPPDSRSRVFLPFSVYFSPSISTCSLWPQQRPPQISLHNGYTRSNQRCKDKSCVFRIPCTHTCPYPLLPSARAYIRCPALIPFLAFFWLLTLDPPPFALTS